MRKTLKSRQEKVKVVGGSTFGRYGKISSAKTFNMFITDNWLCNMPGYQKLLNIVANGEGREIFVSIRGNFIVAVINQTVYRIDPNLDITPIGNLATETGEVFIDENLSSQICIVDGLNAWIYNYGPLGGPFLTLQVTANLVPSYVEYHNNFFLFGNATTAGNGGAWYAYQFATPTTITQVPAPGGQFSIQTKPDFAIAVVRLPGLGNNVLAMGTAVSEIWTQVAGLQNYRRNSTISIDYGCISVSTIAKSDRFVAWLAINEYNQPVIMVFSGQNAQPISTDGIDYLLGQVQFPAQSTAMFFRQDGHLFYQLTFFNPVDNTTIIYDFDGGEEKFFHLTDGGLNYHPARNYVYFNQKTYFISLNTGGLYQSSTNFTTYNENLPNVVNPDQNFEIPRIRMGETIRADDSSQFRANSFTFTIEQGNDPNVTGLSILNNEDLLITEDLFVHPDDVIYTENGIPMADEDSGAGIGAGDLPPPYIPRVDLSISFDGGISFGNTVGRNLNPVGIRQNILNWENMGMCNSWTPQLRFYGTDRFVAYDGVMEMF